MAKGSEWTKRVAAWLTLRGVVEAAAPRRVVAVLREATEELSR
jgi:hypothetical protein